MNIIGRVIAGIICLTAAVLLAVCGLGIPCPEAIIGALVIAGVGLPLQAWLNNIAGTADPDYSTYNTDDSSYDD